MSTTPPAVPAPPPFSYYPGFDGLRGLLVAPMVLYHMSLQQWISGAFVVMSGFFVLSGFLITSLLIIEHQRKSTIEVGRFLVRRARRLLPAALLTIAAVAVLWNIFDLRAAGSYDPEVVSSHTNGDVLASIFYYLNWRTITGPIWSGFGALGTAIFTPLTPPGPSPLGHFWSLAVEEQFYLTLPFMVLLTLRAGDGRRNLAVVTVAVMALLLALQPTMQGVNGLERYSVMDRVYQGTDVRGIEFLMGTLMAALYAYPSVRIWISRSRLVALAGPLALLLIVYWQATQSTTSTWLYNQKGSFALIAIPYVAVVLCLIQDQRKNPLSALLNLGVMRWLGERSYGIYVYHFPIILLVEHVTPGWHLLPTVMTECVLTLFITAVSFTYFEQPIRKGYWPWKRESSQAES